MAKVYMVGDCTRYDDARDLALCSSLDAAVAIATKIVETQILEGELLIAEFVIDAYPKVLTAVYEYDGTLRESREG